ncbi:acylneuraminate cytidylyltransferase family protein [Roseivirga spongicola]|uniref:CMP-N-acetylneuraminic acid synthetase n=1 Tax=Roseivirga spongicola TaxID=333140 RepID=A0A150XII8_9BACT|nr:acylneuraminate cytidylyltransferase family protein [Roseivirga spongicola]KYG78537.1 CMP-N-acetylneuraminic acid synthetase [Roseivirga spongicola]WPZ11932.1 acylneuraminate cytidylyltransferase family protein [Roseivirga spongicola]
MNEALVVIPARGGSKGLKRKNIKLLGGKPLIQYTIDVALELFEEEQVLVSTDDSEIKDIVEELGLKVPFTRPAELATDQSTSREALLHAIGWAENNGMKPDIVIMLQPTSPFRQAVHIKEALEKYHADLDMVVSVKKTKSNPYFVLFEENEHGYLRKSKDSNVTRRQDLPTVWEYNGAVYVINVNSLKERDIHQFERVTGFEMDKESSVDIDDILDWKFSELLISKG